MTPTEFRSTLARLGLTQSGAARLLGVGDRTVRGWAEPPDSPGNRSIPESAIRLLGLIEHVPGVQDWLYKISRKGA